MKKKLTALLCLIVAFITTVSLGAVNAFADGSGEPSNSAFYTDSVITFENATDSDKFDTTYLGWQINDGKYSATGSWGTTYYNQELDLTKTIRIAFDFYLPVPQTEVFDNGMQFNVAIGTLTDINTAPCVHIHNSERNGIYLNTLSDFSGVGNNWKEDNHTVYFDGVEHSAVIAINDSKIKFYVDGVDLYPDYAQDILVPANSGYILFQATDTAYYIDNFSVTEASVDVSVKEFDEDISLNFTDFASSDAFYGLSGAWRRYDDNGNGILKPVAKWNSTRLNTKLILTLTLTTIVWKCI